VLVSCHDDLNVLESIDVGIGENKADLSLFLDRAV
jgi:hypothetical protein